MPPSVPGPGPGSGPHRPSRNVPQLRASPKGTGSAGTALTGHVGTGPGRRGGWEGGNGTGGAHSGTGKSLSRSAPRPALKPPLPARYRPPVPHRPAPPLRSPLPRPPVPHSPPAPHRPSATRPSAPSRSPSPVPVRPHRPAPPSARILSRALPVAALKAQRRCGAVRPGPARGGPVLRGRRGRSARCGHTRGSDMAGTRGHARPFVRGPDALRPPPQWGRPPPSSPFFLHAHRRAALHTHVAPPPPHAHPFARTQRTPRACASPPPLHAHSPPCTPILARARALPRTSCTRTRAFPRTPPPLCTPHSRISMCSQPPPTTPPLIPPSQWGSRPPPPPPIAQRRAPPLPPPAALGPGER